MSLDVWLETSPTHTCSACGHQDALGEGVHVYSANITHNLARMAVEAGLYECLWCPAEWRAPAGAVRRVSARELIPTLEAGLALLRAEPRRFEALAPENGWGSYEGLVEFVAAYLTACREHPDAAVSAWR